MCRARGCAQVPGCARRCLKVPVRGMCARVPLLDSLLLGVSACASVPVTCLCVPVSCVLPVANIMSACVCVCAFLSCAVRAWCAPVCAGGAFACDCCVPVCVHVLCVPGLCPFVCACLRRCVLCVPCCCVCLCLAWAVTCAMRAACACACRCENVTS